MANVKKVDKIDKEELTKSIEKEVVDEVIVTEEVKNEIDPKDAMIEQLKEQMQQMQAALIAMQGNDKNKAVGENSTIYEIGTRLVNGVTIYSPRREVEKEIPFNKIIELDKYELDMLLKSNYVKEWLEKDVLFFNNEEAYEERRIKKQYDLTDESLIDMILNQSTVEVMEALSKMTRKYKDDPMIHCIFYRIVELCSNGSLSKMPHETRQEIEKEFNFKIDNAQMLFRGFRDLK